VLAVILLAGAVFGIFVHPRWLPYWAPPVVAAVLVVASASLTIDEARHALRPLAAPLAFLLAAVPLAALLDRLGFFSALANLVDSGRHLGLGLWCLAAAVTTVFNLDASVVLLTPLYIRIAVRHQIPPLELAIQPVLLAALASSALPVSNLTNLIAAEQLDLSSADFLTHLALPSLVATVVGYLAYRRVLSDWPDSASRRDPVDRRALWRGGPVVAFVLVGFVFGDRLGVPAYAVALMADAVLLIQVRDRRAVAIPWQAAALASGLAVTAAAAVQHLDVTTLLGHGTGALADLRVAGLAAAGADAVNNLPALLVSVPSLARSDQIWPLLLGLNMGAGLVITGALAGLLWRDTARRLELVVSVRAFSRWGLAVVAPGFVCGLITLIAMRQL